MQLRFPIILINGQTSNNVYLILYLISQICEKQSSQVDIFNNQLNKLNDIIEIICLKRLIQLILKL
ncbi:hypothetical protein pb186bvf_012295 [Paramecium bursaria]